ncbi:MAG: GH92 family glycosyl hydrolase [Actinobacteria bacterium]|nr:GH92 family glycosyl hydrolase [Actinomycetota bacterium]
MSPAVVSRLTRRYAARIAVAALASGALIPPAAAAGFDPSRYVNVFNGTAPSTQDFGTGGGAGNTFPGVARPFGMVQLSPDTYPSQDAFGGGYTYGDSTIKGFSLRHTSGPGCAAYQDFPITPTTQPIGPFSPVKSLTIDLNSQYSSSFDHAHERASPGRYDVTLDPGTSQAIDASLGSTVRTGAARFTFPRGSGASVLINAAGSAMGASSASVSIDPAHHEISGSVTSGQFCYQRNRYTLYFAARFSRPFASFGTWRREVLLPGSTSNSDTIGSDPFVYQPIPGGPSGAKDGGVTAQTGGYASFDVTTDRTVEVRIGVSSVSVAGARANLDAESSGRTLDGIRAAGRRDWDRALGHIRVRGGSRANLRRFYTQLYHALLEPSTFSDADGRYAGFDQRVHGAGRHVQYADFSGWDTYRSQMQLIALLFPRRASDIVRSLLADARDSGFLPKWSQANDHTHVMVGDAADLLIADAWAFGARGFDRRAALAAMVKGATDYDKASTSPDYYERPALADYLRLGYVPHEDNTSNIAATFQPQAAWGSVSTTMEYALADFGVARMAAAVCDKATYGRFMQRSGNWRRVFDPAVRYVQPRNADGSFGRAAPTDGTDFVEGDAAQYTLFVPHDPAALIRALGGRKAALARLDAFFKQINAGPSAPYAYLGNEPTLDTPWLYDWIGRPGRAAAVVRRALLGLYTDDPSGMPGNDDLGSMSSWWVFGALGLYPAVPGTDLLAIGSPLFRSTTVHLGRGTLRIGARGAAPQHPYVRGLAVDGRRRTKPWVRFDALARGGRLDFVLGRRAGRRFGRRRGDAPPSFGPATPLPCG